MFVLYDNRLCHTKDSQLECQNVCKTRNNIIKKLNEQKEIEKFLKIYVDNTETFVDTDDVHWKPADIILTTKEKASLWKNFNFRKNILRKCYLWETFSTQIGQNSREDIRRM